MRQTYYSAALSPHEFEKVMLFRGHYFEAPPEPKLKSAQEIREERRRMDREATLGMMAALEELVEAKRD